MAAKRELDGQKIYAGCCTLRLQYSSLTNLNVKFNNEKSRDFSNSSLPSGPAGGSGLPAGVDPVASGLAGMYADPTQMAWAGWGMPQPPTMGYPGASYGSVPPTKTVAGGSSAVLIVSGLDEQVRVVVVISLPRSINSFVPPTLQTITPDTLFTLFGVYGDVIRVKIMYQKKHTALIQFTNAQQAETAMLHLNGLNWRGNTLKINFSKYQSIAMPKPGVDGVC